MKGREESNDKGFCLRQQAMFSFIGAGNTGQGLEVIVRDQAGRVEGEAPVGYPHLY